MTIELLYTSAAQGLKQGSRGFCTVVCTAGLPINLAQRLEALSGYRHLYQPGDQRADDNPVCYSHIRLGVGGKTLSILSRVGAYGVDYSQRTNKIAHHVVFDGPVPECGPAAVLSQSGIMRINWDGVCKTLQSGPEVSSMNVQPAPCKEWKRITGDAGWAGVLANAWLQPTSKPVWIVFSESQSASLLDLMLEATAILPESRRWQATFSTYCTNLPPDVECRVRCVNAGSDEARMSIARGTVLDLTKPMEGAPVNDATNAARHGYTIGARSNFVPPVPELSNVSDQTIEEIEAALSAHASDDNEYQFQQQIPSKLPIPLAMPNRRPGNDANRRGAKSSTRQSKFWRVLTVAASVLMFLSLVGASVFYFATTKNPLAGIVEKTSKERPKQAPEKPKDTPRTKTVDKDPAQNKGAANNDSEENQPQATSHEIQLSLDQTTVEINENKNMDADLSIASLKVTHAKSSDVKLSDESQDFALRDGEVYLRKKKDGYNYEATPELNWKLTIGDKSFPFSLKVKNLNDTDLKLVISDDIGKPSAMSVFEGTKLKADVDAGSKDDDEDKESKRTFSWKGHNGDGEWTVFETKQQVQITSQFTEVYCELTYATSFPSPETKVKSDKITIQPLGKATIEFSSIFFALNFDMQIEVSFPELSVESPKIRYPFRWMEHDKYLDGNKLKIDLGSNGANQFNLPSKYFKFVSASDDGVANGWLQKAIWQSKAVRDNVSKLKNSMGLLKLHFARSQVATAFMQFVYEIKESPSEEFFHSIESVDEWIRTAVALKNLANEIKEDEKKQGKATKELESKQTKKLADLKHLETQFANVFAKHPIATFASADVEHEIVGFARIWDRDLDPKNENPNKVENIVRRHLTDLVRSVHDLRATMKPSSEYEIVLESQDKIRIWKIDPKKVTNDGLSGKKKDADSIYNQLFRVRTGVLFQDVKPEIRDSTVSGLRDKVDRSMQPQTQSSSDTPPKPAKQPEVQ